MEKVVCALCRLEDNRRCIKKNAKVKINKPRICPFYKEDENKLNMMKEKESRAMPMTIKRPDHYWDGAKIKEERKKAREEEARRQSISSTSNDPKHPLTGDLSRFVKSTATENSEEE